MTLNEFINEYDKAGSIILLEGKRSVLENDKEKLFGILKKAGQIFWKRLR